LVCIVFLFAEIQLLSVSPRPALPFRSADGSVPFRSVSLPAVRLVGFSFDVAASSGSTELLVWVWPHTNTRTYTLWWIKPGLNPWAVTAVEKWTAMHSNGPQIKLELHLQALAIHLVWWTMGAQGQQMAY